MTTQTRNEVLLEGTPLDTPQLSHENHGTRFYRFYLEVPRLSGTPDTLPVLLPEVLLPQIPREGPLQIHGQLRSFNNRSGVGSRLVLTVYALDIQPGTGEACNQIFLTGSLCKPPVFRRTPLGRSICDLMLAAGMAGRITCRSSPGDSWRYRPAVWRWATPWRWKDGSKAGSTIKSPKRVPRSGSPTRSR